MRAGMTASRLDHRGRVIPAQTDHLEDLGGVIGLDIDGRASGFFKTPSGLLAARLTQRVLTRLGPRPPV
jgi:hypothetical protein